MMRPGRPPRRVAASALGEFVACELRSVLRARFGDVVAPERSRRRAEGDAEHARMHRLALDHEARKRSVRDRGCFIASAVFGADDPRTEALRRYRDRCLMPRVVGRWGVACYYAVSPYVAKTLIRYPAAARVIGRVLTGVVRILSFAQRK